MSTPNTGQKDGDDDVEGEQDEEELLRCNESFAQRHVQGTCPVATTPDSLFLTLSLSLCLPSCLSIVYSLSVLSLAILNPTPPFPS